tara:strand:- start:20209 stop:22008 length:1800 start_codon:yes stop_codon:yes gene_type:complete
MALYQQASDESLLETLNLYIEQWDKEITSDTFIKDVSDMIGTDFDDIGNNMMCLGSELQQRNLMNTVDCIDTLIQYNNLLEKIHYAKHAYNQYLAFSRTKEDGYDWNMNTDTTMFRFTPFVFDKLSPFQKLVFILMDYMHTHNLKRVDDKIYEQIYTPSGVGTHAWKEKSSILEEIHHQCNMVTNYKNWVLMTSGTNIDKQLVEHFMNTKDDRFMMLEKNRHVFAFENGLYIANANIVGIESDTLTDCFIEYDTDQIKIVKNDIVACKYFPIRFNCIHDKKPESLDTPFLDQIFHYQKLDEDVIRICYMFIGRMLYDVGELDTWQVMPMYLGTAASGKSTIINIITHIYDSENVGVMGNNFQKTFGLADIYDKFCFIAPEVKKDFNIDSAELQEIMSGGTLNVNIKCKKSVRVDWKASGIFGGNEVPNFVDNSGSIQRRVVVTRFDKKVIDKDPLLHKKLQGEIDKIMRKCNLYYLQYVNDYGHKDIWKYVLPEYYTKTQSLLASATNSLSAFMESDILDFDDTKYIPYDEFWKRFNLFCQENNMQKQRITIDFYQSNFDKYGLTVSKENKKYPIQGGKMYRNTKFIMGVDINMDDDDL